MNKFSNESTDCDPPPVELPQENPSTDESNNPLKRESTQKVLSLESIEEDNIPLKVLKRNIKTEKVIL